MADRTQIVYDQLNRPYEALPIDAPTQAQLDAVAQKIPQPPAADPLSEKTGAARGVTDQFARADHQHGRLTSATYATLDSNGKQFVAFTRTFANKPTLILTETDADENSAPIALRGLAWRKNADGAYDGVTIQGRRSRMLPDLAPVSGILTAVITGVNTLVSALAKFDVFAAPASGAAVSVVLLARSDVSSA